ncbi:SulP family inorganic anion transporter [Protaetiibacter sp. SSC-01]|uniref:SulP family inorganic anion transporter n=1 Tax=Protaetiibacter sp. SSC-01 TaxID=2759943 RepID=UPI001656B7AF|nr:SulP family inorganic anion transporter [Protaetiibacter sp. SSC-01]QNO38077.1 SulP family inorganic anion transporter [Protaetiibacter sp. SSC-01]
MSAADVARRTGRRIRALLPSAEDYRPLRRSWRGDLVAGLTVGIVALPLALGFGISSGAGAEAGLITAIIAGVVAAVFGGSNVQVSGPTGAMVVVLAPIVAQYGVGAVALLSVMAGVIVLVAGALRLGRAVSFIPWPVIEGFTLGIAVIIFLQQVPALTRADTGGTSHTNVVVTAVDTLVHADPAYLLWALGAVAVVALCMVLLPKLHPSIPGSLIGIALVAVLALLLPTPLADIGELPSSLPPPSFPALDLGTLGHLALPALTVAALAAIESLLSARVAASLADTGPYDPDRELVGQGLASVAAGLFGGMPATGAIARTAVNVRSGAQTRVAAVFHAVVLLLVVLVAAQPVGLIPLAALSGVLMVTAVRMVHRATVRSILRSTRADAIAFVVTAIVTISVDLIVAVAIGMVVAGIFAIRSLSRATGVTREELGEPVPGDERIALIRLDGPLFFAAADRVFDTVTALENVSVVILRMSQIELVDATGAHVLSEIVQRLEARGITVLIKGVREGHVELFRTVGVLSALRHHKHLFDDLPSAIEHARSHIAREAAG